MSRIAKVREICAGVDLGDRMEFCIEINSIAPLVHISTDGTDFWLHFLDIGLAPNERWFKVVGDDEDILQGERYVKTIGDDVDGNTWHLLELSEPTDEHS